MDNREQRLSQMDETMRVLIHHFVAKCNEEKIEPPVIVDSLIELAVAIMDSYYGGSEYSKTFLKEMIEEKFKIYQELNEGVNHG